MIFIVLIVISYFASIRAAAYKMSDLRHIEFKFVRAENIPQAVKQANLHHELRLILIGSKDYLVAGNSLPDSSSCIRISENEVSAVTITSL